MYKKGIIVDINNFKIWRECIYDDKRVEDMYYRVDDKDLIPITYIFPIENKDKVVEQLERLKLAKKAYEAVQSDVFYKQFPTLR